MHLDPTSLRLFISVIDLGSIAKAAEKNYIAASAISKRIAELEQLLNTPLLQRTNRGVVATEAGRELVARSRLVLYQLDDIYSQINEYASGVRGTVRVGANISAISEFLPQQLRTFLDMHPLVQIDLEEKISSEIINDVSNGIVDIGLVSDVAGAATQLKVYPYKKDYLFLITPQGHPLASCQDIWFEDTLNYDYVGLHTGSAINNQIIHVAASLNKELRLRMQVTNYEALVSMVESGLGIGLMPHNIAKRYLKASRIAIVPLLDDWAERELKICARDNEQLLDGAQRLLQHLRTT